ncbi:hypothetical protein FA95DRAFT_1610588, partial [Auriscalpium vulgare]
LDGKLPLDLLPILPPPPVAAPASRRELEERLSPIVKGILGTVTGLGVSGAASSIIDKVFGSSSRRAVTPEQALAAVLLSGRSFNELD